MTDPSQQAPLQATVEAARRDDRRVLLEGVHALKHAVRFGATIERIVSPDPDALARLLADLAPDVTLPRPVEEVDEATWDVVARGGLPSPSLAIATRPPDMLDHALATPRGPIVALQDPTHLGNVGAVVRVAAAADVDGVVVLGRADPWHPRAVRGGAGLQFALPVGRRDVLAPTARSLVALDPDGDHLADVAIPPDAILAFGAERHGLSPDLLARADLRVRLPMRTGVSSLNLATSVAATLYGMHGRE